MNIELTPAQVSKARHALEWQARYLRTTANSRAYSGEGYAQHRAALRKQARENLALARELFRALTTQER